MSRPEKAVCCFRDGFNCAQAVFSTFSDMLGMEKEQALKLATGFGSGVATMGEVCGAVSGAVMAISMQHGRTRLEDVQSKENTYVLINKFVQTFRQTHSTIICRELIGCELSTPEGIQKAKDGNLFATHCARYVRDAATILDDMLK